MGSCQHLSRPARRKGYIGPRTRKSVTARFPGVAGTKNTGRAKLWKQFRTPKWQSLRRGWFSPYVKLKLSRVITSQPSWPNLQPDLGVSEMHFAKMLAFYILSCYGISFLWYDFNVIVLVLLKQDKGMPRKPSKAMLKFWIQENAFLFILKLHGVSLFWQDSDALSEIIRLPNREKRHAPKFRKTPRSSSDIHGTRGWVDVFAMWRSLPGR